MRLSRLSISKMVNNSLIICEFLKYDVAKFMHMITSWEIYSENIEKLEYPHCRWNELSWTRASDIQKTTFSIDISTET